MASGDLWSASHARSAWLIYAAVTVAGSLYVLMIFVNAYDDNGLTERLRTLGVFQRRSMEVLAFPLGAALGAVTNGPLEGLFGCVQPNEPCAVFVNWWTHFVALLAQIVILRVVIQRASTAG